MSRLFHAVRTHLVRTNLLHVGVAEPCPKCEGTGMCLACEGTDPLCDECSGVGKCPACVGTGTIYT